MERTWLLVEVEPVTDSNRAIGIAPDLKLLLKFYVY
jgi:hypothetical protein